MTNIRITILLILLGITSLTPSLHAMERGKEEEEQEESSQQEKQSSTPKRSAQTGQKSGQTSAKKTKLLTQQQIALNARLTKAISDRNFEEAQLAYEEGADIHCINDAGLPLCIAALEGRIDIVEWLLGLGATINDRDGNGDSPAHKAAYHNQIDVLRFLFAHGADIRAVNNDGEEPIHEAAHHESIDALAWLLAHGADINARDGNNKQPKHIAAECDYIDTLEWLFAHGATFELQDQNLLRTLKNRDTIVAELLKGTPINEILDATLQSNYGEEELRRRTFVMIALGYNDVAIALLNARSHLLTLEALKYALEVAAATNNLPMLEELHTRAFTIPNINRQHIEDMLGNALHWAIIGRSEDSVDFILERALGAPGAPQLNLTSANQLATLLIRTSRREEDISRLTAIQNRLVTPRSGATTSMLTQVSAGVTAFALSIVLRQAKNS